MTVNESLWKLLEKDILHVKRCSCSQWVHLTRSKH